jgi:hypothetical protein
MRQFSVGEVVTCIPDMFLRYAAAGDFKIIATMPDRDGDHMYRIKSPLEEYERVVGKSSHQVRGLSAGRNSKEGIASEINHTAHAARSVETRLAPEPRPIFLFWPEHLHRALGSCACSTKCGTFLDRMSVVRPQKGEFSLLGLRSPSFEGRPMTSERESAF